MAFLLGIEIGGSKLQIVTGAADGTIVDRQRISAERSQGAAGIREQIESAVTRLQPRFRWDAVGVGYGGPVDWTTGRICCSHQVEGWNDFALGDWLRALTGLPVAVDNDANVAAYGEARRGVGAGFNPVFYTNSGSGIGGGLVVDGKIYHGAKPGESELGHVRLDKQGTTVEEHCSGWAVDKKVRELAARNPGSALGRLAADMNGGEARALGPALREKCPFAQRILGETAEDLAFALSHATHLFHPQVIVLGGGLALIGEPWREAIATALPHFVMGAFAPGPPVRLTGLGEDAVPLGALLLAGMALA
jgi:glucokinase